MSGELLPADWRAVGFVSSQLQLREASFSFNEGVEMERGFSELCWGEGGGGGGGGGVKRATLRLKSGGKGSSNSNRHSHN